jgi:hypothetical protein
MDTRGIAEEKTSLFCYGRGMGQSMRRERECVLGLGPSILPGVLWSR